MYDNRMLASYPYFNLYLFTMIALVIVSDILTAETASGALLNAKIGVIVPSH